MTSTPADAVTEAAETYAALAVSMLPNHGTAIGNTIDVTAYQTALVKLFERSIRANLPVFEVDDDPPRGEMLFGSLAILAFYMALGAGLHWLWGPLCK